MPKMPKRKIHYSKRSMFWPCGDCRKNCITHSVEWIVFKLRYHYDCQDLSTDDIRNLEGSSCFSCFNCLREEIGSCYSYSAALLRLTVLHSHTGVFCIGAPRSSTQLHYRLHRPIVGVMYCAMTLCMGIPHECYFLSSVDQMGFTRDSWWHCGSLTLRNRPPPVSYLSYVQAIYGPSYTQEIGYAGRDGFRAQAILYYNATDVAQRHIDSTIKDFCKSN